jgi:hypothetical protein
MCTWYRVLVQGVFKCYERYDSGIFSTNIEYNLDTNIGKINVKCVGGGRGEGEHGRVELKASVLFIPLVYLPYYDKFVFRML